jgi:hypothetical protein
VGDGRRGDQDPLGRREWFHHCATSRDDRDPHPTVEAGKDPGRPWRSSGRSWRPIETGLRLLRFGGHLPAHLFRPTQRKANAAALAGLADALAPVIAATKPDEVTGSFDFNRPLTSTRHAKLITDAVAPLGLRLVVPPKATLGLRTIDGFVTNARCVPVDGATGMLPRQPGFDHRGCRMHTCACVTAVQA